MTIENPSERLERTEAYLKQRLSNYKSIMPVKGWGGATLLEIYWEWMDYLVKENLKKRSDLLQRWKKFLLERNTDAIADLIIGFFEAKRRYGRDMERGEDRRDWFSLCSNYCKKNWWHDDEKLLHSFFSSYSWAERRIYHKIEKGKVLADTSKSLLQTMELTKAEMVKKEEEKKRKAEEKKRRKEEKEKEKTAKKAKKPKADIKVTKSSDWNEEDKEVDPDYPKTPEWRSGPTDPRFSWPSFQTDEKISDSKKEEKSFESENKLSRDDKWNLVDKYGQTWLDFGE